MLNKISSALSYIVALARTVLFYIFTGVILLIIVAPIANIVGLFCSKDTATKGCIILGSMITRLFRLFIGVSVEYRGLHHLIDGPCILASKHQSAYETITTFNKFYPRAAYVIKDGYGWAFFYLYFLYRKYNGIVVKRSDGAKALIHLEKQALEKLKEGRQVVIFPEGTRVDLGEAPPFKRGIERLYEKSGAPVIPVALNTAGTMPKGSKVLFPGKIVIEFLPPIMPGLDKQEFSSKLYEAIKNNTSKLESELVCNYYVRKKQLPHCVSR